MSTLAKPGSYGEAIAEPIWGKNPQLSKQPGEYKAEQKQDA